MVSKRRMAVSPADCDVNQVAQSLPLVALHRRSWLQVAESPQAEPAEGSGNGGEGSRQPLVSAVQADPSVSSKIWQ